MVHSIEAFISVGSFIHHRLGCNLMGAKTYLYHGWDGAHRGMDSEKCSVSVPELLPVKVAGGQYMVLDRKFRGAA